MPLNCLMCTAPTLQSRAAPRRVVPLRYEPPYGGFAALEQYWRQRPITQADVLQSSKSCLGCALVKIYDNTLWVGLTRGFWWESTKPFGFKGRLQAFMLQLYVAVASYEGSEPLPNVEFVVSVQDARPDVQWGYCNHAPGLDPPNHQWCVQHQLDWGAVPWDTAWRRTLGIGGAGQGL